MFNDIVKLNVGGVKYSSTRSTLIKHPKSMLGAMFSGQIPSQLDEDGNFFIDRDGKIFRYILQFLRSGEVTLPKEHKDYSLLQSEALFYQIQPLIETLTLLDDPIIENVEKGKKEMITVYFPHPMEMKYYCQSGDHNLYELIHSREIVDSNSYTYDEYVDDNWEVKERKEASSWSQLASLLLLKGFSKPTIVLLESEHEELDDLYHDGPVVMNHYTERHDGPVVMNHYTERQKPTEVVSPVTS